MPILLGVAIHASQSGETAGSNVTLEIVQWAFAVLGAVAAAQQLIKWITGRRAERGLTRLLENFADQADAEQARMELSALQRTVSEIEGSLPSLVQRLHLEQRRVELVDSIGRDFVDYVETVRGLQRDPLADLNERTVDVIQQEILPQYESQSRSRRQARSLLILILILVVVPYSLNPSRLIELGAYSVVVAVAYPAEGVSFAPGPSIGVSLTGLLLGFGLAHALGRRGAPRLQGQGLQISLALAALLVSNIAVGSLWIAVGDNPDGDVAALLREITVALGLVSLTVGAWLRVIVARRKP